MTDEARKATTLAMRGLRESEAPDAAVRRLPAAAAVLSAYYLPISDLTSPRLHAIKDATWQIGRDKTSAFVVTHQGASRVHASLNKDEMHRLHALVDHHSANGTMLNGLFVRRVFAHTGDRIDVPGARFFYYREGTERTCALESADVTITDDVRRRCLQLEAARFTIFRVSNYHALLDAFEFRALRAISEHISGTLSTLLPFARIEALRDGFEYVLVTSEIDRATDSLLGKAFEHLAVADLGEERSVALDVEFTSSLVSSAEAIRQLRSRTRRLRPLSLQFNWLHLSDLHIGAGNPGWRMNREQVISAIVRDLEATSRHMRFDRLFVTGDVSFSGEPAQFSDALVVLQDIANVTALDLSQVRVVPGNHDVQRQLAARPVTQALHAQVRQHAYLLDTLLGDELGRKVLSEKLAAFSQFVGSLRGHPTSRDSLDWIEECAVGERIIRIFGICSTWVSDERDGRSQEGGGPFVPNLVLPHRTIAEIGASRRRSDATLVLTHHPEDWLVQFSRRLFHDAMSGHSGIHLCGHVHELDSWRRSAHGGYSRFVMNAGASHSGPDEPATHTYCWGSLVWDERDACWKLGWSPRVFVPSRNEMRPDRKTYDLDEAGFCWQVVQPTEPKGITRRPASAYETGEFDKWFDMPR